MIAADGAAYCLLGTGPVTGEGQDLGKVERSIAVIDGGIRGRGEFLDALGERDRRNAVTLAGEQSGIADSGRPLGWQGRPRR